MTRPSSLFSVLCLVFFVSSFVCLSFASTKWFQLDNYSFENYIQEFDKQYSSPAEYSFRKDLFETRLSEIRRHNADQTQTWKKGVNKFTDRTDAEFRVLLGNKKHLIYQSRAQEASPKPLSGKSYVPEMTLPLFKDWRIEQVVSPVKDQGQCGSCWTFAASETIESHYALVNGKLPLLSEQQIASCTPNPNECGGTGGCQGATVELAFQHIINGTKGLASEWTYPYMSYFGNNYQCQFDRKKTKPIVNIDGYVKLPSNEYHPLMQAIATVGPIAISVDASNWNSYESGIFTGCNQTNPDINHAVQLVGYGTAKESGQDYWLVRNSWGVDFGEGGYIRLVRSSSVECGIDLNPSDGTGCKGGPATVKVCGTCGILYDNAYPIIKRS